MSESECIVSLKVFERTGEGEEGMESNCAGRVKGFEGQEKGKKGWMSKCAKEDVKDL